MVPVIQVAEASRRGAIAAEDIDLFLGGEASADTDALAHIIAAVAQRERTPVANAQGFVDFQLTRGELGLTT